MSKFLFICFLVLNINVNAQYFPILNESYNYTQMPFEWDAVANATNYIITIKEENKSTFLFSKKINNNILLLNDVLQFGKKYIWQINSYNNNKKISTSIWMPFSINTSPNILQKNIQFNITTSKNKLFQNDLLFIENLGIAINRKGKPVWFLQRDETVELDEKSYRSLQLTNDGKITFLTSSNAYETDLQGNITWEAPKNGIVNIGGLESYHHHFAKTPFDSYMCTSYAYTKQQHFYNDKQEVLVRYNTLIEYDKYGNLLWSWNEKDHADLKMIFENSTGEESEWAGTHMNGFVFSEKDNALYLSCRNSSQVQKIDYLTGKVLYTWSGKPSKFNKTDFTFYNQHGPSLTTDGNLIIYNNNIKTDENKKPVYPTIQIVQNPINNQKGKLLWEYECKWDAKKEGIQTKEGFAIELQNKNILVNVGGTERIFEVNKKKEIVWDCNFKKKDKDSLNYVTFSNYRCYNAMSLHPVLFAVNGNIIAKQKQLIINNLGNSDAFIITIMDMKETMQLHTFTKKVNANSIAVVQLNKELKTLPTNFIIKVTSSNNKLKTKKLNY